VLILGAKETQLTPAPFNKYISPKKYSINKY
jgi:hypothetical protein